MDHVSAVTTSDETARLPIPPIHFSPAPPLSLLSVNSWDRQPYLTLNGVDDGYKASDKLGFGDASIVKAQCHLTKNFIINGYNGVWAIDHGKLKHDGRFLLLCGCFASPPLIPFR